MMCCTITILLTCKQETACQIQKILKQNSSTLNELVPPWKILEVIEDRNTWDLKKSIEGAYIIQEMSRQA